VDIVNLYFVGIYWVVSKPHKQKAGERESNYLFYEFQKYKGKKRVPTGRRKKR